MKLLQILALLLTALAIASCVHMQRPPEVKLPPDRISLIGYSFTPLNERGWLVAGKNSYNIALVKRGKNTDETFAIQTMRFQLPEFKTQEDFARLIKGGQVKDTDSQRFKITKHEVSDHLAHKTNCAISHMATEDHGAVKRSTNKDAMTLEALVLTCAHPKDKNIGINVSFSQRYYPGQKDPALVKKGMIILNSVIFNDI